MMSGLCRFGSSTSSFFASSFRYAACRCRRFATLFSDENGRQSTSTVEESSTVQTALPEFEASTPFYEHGGVSNNPNKVVVKTSADETGYGPRMHEYRDIGKMVNLLETATQRIDFVSPYERDWTPVERRYDRPYNLRLLRPRGAYVMDAAPSMYDALPFYKFITRTAVDTNTLPEEFYQHDDEQFNSAVRMAEQRFREQLEALWCQREEQEQESSVERQSVTGMNHGLDINRFIGNVHEQLARACIHALISHDAAPWLRDAQVTRDACVESYWARGGFEALYPHPSDDPSSFDYIDKEEQPREWLKKMQELRSSSKRATGDDHRRRGELLFCSREKHDVLIRTDALLPPINADPPRLDETDELPPVYSPRSFGLFSDTDRMLMLPGFEIDRGDPMKYNFLSFVNTELIAERVSVFQCGRSGQVDEMAKLMEENMVAMAIMTCFSQLTAVAHSLGYTPYNDIERPLTAQAVLSNGRYFAFVVYQLNSLNLAFDFAEQRLINRTLGVGLPSMYYKNDVPPEPNYCWMTEPMELFPLDGFKRHDSISGQFTNWNAEPIIKQCMRMLLRQPERQNALNNETDAVEHQSRSTNTG